MASGKISKKITGREYYISWSSVANVENNTSTITCEHYLKNDNSYSLRVGGGTISSCSVGTDYKEYTSPAIYTDGGQTHHLGTTTHTVAHNSDGSKSVSIQGSYAISATLSGTWYATLDASGTAVLDKIPRQATLDSAPNFEDIDNPKITYTNEAGNSVDSLQACIADANGETVYVSYRNISKTGSSYTFNLTDAERNALRNAIPNDNSMTVKFYVKCVIGSKIYYSSLAKTFTIVNANPTFNPTITDINTETTALTGDSSKLIRYYSDVNITTGASAVKGAKLVSQKVMNGGKSITTASGSITDVESGTFTFTATDSRGNTTTQKIEKNIVNYIKLTLNISNKTPDASGNFTFTVNGNYFDGSFGVKSNSLTVKYRYCVKGDEDNFSEWADMNISPGYGTYSATAELSGLDYQTTYTFQARAYDLLETVDRERAIKATPVFDWSEDDFNFNVPVSMSAGFSTNNQWIPLVLNSGFAPYQSATSNNPKCKKCGSVITITGCLTPNSTFTSSIDEVDLFNGIPDDCCPDVIQYMVCQGSGMNRWLLAVKPDGSATMARYGANDFATLSSGNWLPFTITYQI